jgi:putative PEP-CTERM system histidine kinase
VVHDLKNLIAQLSLVVRNAERHRHNPAFIDDAMATIESSVDKMNRLLGQLRSPVGREVSTCVDLRGVVGEVVRSRAVQEPAPLLEDAVQDPMPVCADADRLGSVIAHVVQNAQEATPRDGRVIVRVGRTGAEAAIEVRDTGCGMDAEFVRERLFKPFDSTKGLTGMGIGAYEARELGLSLGGRVSVESSPGCGTLFRIILPIATEAASDLGVAAG